MKPFIGAIVIVASDHIAIAHIMAQTVFLVVASLVVFSVAHDFIPVGIFAICSKRDS